MLAGGIIMPQTAIWVIGLPNGCKDKEFNVVFCFLVDIWESVCTKMAILY